MNDFDKAHALVPKYKAAHVFFTEGKSNDLKRLSTDFIFPVRAYGDD